MTDASHALRLLVVEDERHLAAGIKLNFELDGYEVDVAESARDAAARVLAERYHAILLDVMLPDASGLEFCQRLRSSGNFTPVLMLTALGSPEERVRGLEAGADDYLAKPFDLKELLARVRSMIRRQGWERDRAAPAPETLEIGDAVIDFSAFEVRRGEEEIPLTRLEFDLLRYFAENPGRVLSRRELQENVWKIESGETRAPDNFVARLRKHFEDDTSNPRYFVSVRGSGYKFVPGED
jgi:DNA-binding response OmpR family regulator